VLWRAYNRPVTQLPAALLATPDAPEPAVVAAAPRGPKATRKKARS
jgi:hypothetical protein